MVFQASSHHQFGVKIQDSTTITSIDKCQPISELLAGLLHILL